jgi:hypothetical protein
MAEAMNLKKQKKLLLNTLFNLIVFNVNWGNYGDLVYEQALYRNNVLNQNEV